MGVDARAGLAPMRTYDFRTDDLDEATDFLFQHFGPNTRTIRTPAPLGFRLSASITPRAASGHTTTAVKSTLRAATRWVTVHLPARHEVDYQLGRRRLRSTPRVAVLLAPGHEYTRNTPPGREQAIQVEPVLLQKVLDDCAPERAVARIVKSAEIPMGPAHRAAFAALAAAHAECAIGRACGTERPDCSAVEERLARWIADLVAEASGSVRLSPSGREAAERVDAWIRTHFPHPIELDQLCEVAGVVGRTLQKACLARWGQSPLELVASRRLEHARVLLSSEAVPKVTSAAVQSGFTHFGRFSIMYRRHYGESPSETLAKARETTGSPSSRAVSSRNGATSRPVTGRACPEPVARSSTRVTDASSLGTARPRASVKRSRES